jgi:3-dehydroquinate dehydratase
MKYYFPEASFSAKYLGVDLKKLIELNTSKAEIGHLMYQIFSQYSGSMSKREEQIIMTLMLMEEGKEFELHTEQILELADELINLNKV